MKEFKWHEPKWIMNNRGIILTSERTFFGESKLTFIQKVVCKLFKITPLLKHLHKFKVTVDVDFLRTTNIIMTNDSNMWYVSYVNNEIELICLAPIQEVNRLHGEFILISSSITEF